MGIISRKQFREFWEKYPDAEKPLRSWFSDAKNASWKTPTAIKRDYSSASFLGENRVIFNIKGNKYRLITALNYDFGIIYIRFIGTHQEYNKVNALNI